MPSAPDPTGWAASGLRLLDPAARARRRRRRARRSVAYRLLLTVGLAWVTTQVGADQGIELGEVFWGLAGTAAGAGTIGAVHRLWQSERLPRRVQAPKPPAPPPPGSAAHAPLVRLGAREQALAELLGVLGPLAGEAWAEACSAAAALRRLANQILVLESARRGVPADAGPGLDIALAALQLRLEEGVSAYDLLVGAAADAVTATAGGHGDDAMAVRRLEEAADSLAGLARGLRELRTSR